MLKNLIPFFDAEDGATVVNATSTATPIEGVSFQTNENVIPAADPKTTSENADERKTGEDVKSEAQKIADAMVAKKLKNMPSKEELADYRKWKEEQKTESERIADKLSEADKRVAEADMREAKANAMITAAKLGITADHIDDAVILATAKAKDDLTLEEAMKSIAKSNPSWTATVKLPESGSNPAEDDGSKSTDTKRFF